MSRITNPRSRLSPLAPKVVQPNAPAASGVMTALSASAIRAYFQGAGSHHSYQAINPTVAPTATVTAASINRGFFIDDPNHSQSPVFEFPWFVQELFDSVRMLLLIAHKGEIDAVSLRMQARTLVTSVTAVTTQYISLSAGVLVPPGTWRNDDTSTWYVSPAMIEITPNLPSDRTIALRPSIEWSPARNANTLSVTRTFKIYAARIEDTILNLPV